MPGILLLSPARGSERNTFIVVLESGLRVEKVVKID